MRNSVYLKLVAILVLSTITSLVFSNAASADVRYNKNVPANSTDRRGGCVTIADSIWSRSGYLFNGWNSLANGLGVAYAPGDSCASLSDMTWLYAQWVSVSTVAFNSNGGSGSMSNQSAGVTTPLSSNAFTRAGYDFDGWTTNADGTGTSYVDGASYTFASNLTLYAKWTSSVDPAVAAKAAAEAAAKAAAEARAREVEVAKTEIKSVLSSGKPLTADQLLKADINGVTAKNIDLVNADIAKLSDDQKTDIAAVEKVVFKYATVDKVANHSPLSMQDLASVGLVSAESKCKGSISIALKSLPSESLDTYEKISAAVAAVEKKYADRKARLAALLAKKR